MPGIFISYRQDDAKPWALLLNERVADAFGRANVFLDKDTLHAGSWQEQIRSALDQCRVVLLVIGPKWLTVTDEHGARRLSQAEDVHRQEVALALSRKDVTVIPVLVDGATMPRGAELPPDIRDLTNQQARVLSDDTARRQVELQLLFADIERITGRKVATAKRAPAGRGLVSATMWLFTTFAGSVLVLVALEIGLGWTFSPAEVPIVVAAVFGAMLGIRFLARQRKGRASADA